MRKFEYKYKIDEDKRTVVAMSTFAGKVVSGVAHCAPGDTFDVEVGKQLAAARCNLKIAEKRMKRAEWQHSDALEALTFWIEQEAKMKKYDEDSVESYKVALDDLVNLENKFCR